MNTISRDVAEVLLQIKAVKLNLQNPYTWASGILSPIYCDNRKTLSYVQARKIIKESFVEKAQLFMPFNAIAGVATAGIPHGMMLADALNMPFVYVRDKAKGHGMQNRIEGELRGNERVLVIEDLISTGGSSLKAVEALLDFGCDVVGVLAIFSYGFDSAKESFDAHQLPFDTLSNYQDLIALAAEVGYIKDSDVEMLNNWRANPEAWNK